jgi:hypothetical protein
MKINKKQKANAARFIESEIAKFEREAFERINGVAKTSGETEPASYDELMILEEADLSLGMIAARVIRQLTRRATAGNPEAARELALIGIHAAEAIEEISENAPKALKSLQGIPFIPAKIGPHADTGKRADELVRRIGVGTEHQANLLRPDGTRKFWSNLEREGNQFSAIHGRYIDAAIWIIHRAQIVSAEAERLSLKTPDWMKMAAALDSKVHLWSEAAWHILESANGGVIPGELLAAGDSKMQEAKGRGVTGKGLETARISGARIAFLNAFHGRYSL